MSDAKKATAPCGHPGEHVIGNFVRCLTPGCDGTPRKEPVKPAKPGDFDGDTQPLWPWELRNYLVARRGDDIWISTPVGPVKVTN